MKSYLKASVSIAALSLFLAGPVLAADAYNPGGSTKDDPGMFDAPQTVNWTGFYIQGSAGYGNANHDLTVQDFFKDYCANALDTSTGFDGTPGERAVTVDNLNTINNALPIPAALKAAGIRSDCATQAGSTALGIPTATSVATATIPGDSRDVANIDGVNSHGLVGDVRLGADIQRGRFVFGVFGAYGFNAMESEASITGLGNASIEKGEEWSLGARAGILVNPRTLAYILAAYTETEYEFGISGGGTSESKDVSFSGITVGGGIEFAVTNNIFLGIEGTHTFYGEENVLEEYNELANAGGRLVDELSETRVMGTLKIKLNSGLPNFAD